MITITLPYLPPKEFSRNARGHWSGLHRIQGEVRDDVYALLLEAGWAGKPLKLATVRMTFILPNRIRRDGDNLITSAKPCLDALVSCGVILDDCLSCIGFPAYYYAYSPEKKAETIIEVEVRKE